MNCKIQIYEKLKIGFLISSFKFQVALLCDDVTAKNARFFRNDGKELFTFVPF